MPIFTSELEKSLFFVNFVSLMTSEPQLLLELLLFDKIKQKHTLVVIQIKIPDLGAGFYIVG